MSGFPAVFELSSLTGANGFQINGEAAGDASGYSVASAGDVNGDGFDDLIVGAFGADPNGSYSGASYVVFGQAAGFAAEIELSDLDGTNGFQVSGEAEGDSSGRPVASAGDVNGDGFDDVIIGADIADPNGSGSGASYVVFGQAGGFAAEIELSDLDGTNGFQISGEAESDFSGISVALAGDVNGDGFDDLIIGAFGADPNGSYSGASYVVFGKAGGFAAEIELSDLDGTNGFQINGETFADDSGASVASAGDVNGDGFDDLIIGADNADPNGSGASYVVFGQAGGFAAEIELSDLDGTNGFQISGEAAEDRAGASVASAGDVNGDGFDDLIIGALLADPNGSYSGASYVVFGHAGGFAAEIELSDLDGTNGFQISGEADGDWSGRSVASAGDVNGDGFDDLIIGALLADPNGGYSGASYVVFGQAGGFAAEIELSDLDGTNGFQISGGAKRNGNSVASAGDVNGDGFDDVIVGAFGAGNYSGATYVVFGEATGPINRIGTENGDRLFGGDLEDNLDGRGGDDLLKGGGGKDTLDGGSGAGDTADYSDKAVSVAVTLQGATVATVKVGGVVEDTIRNFENLTGGTGDDTLIGDGQANVLNGVGGNDLLKGGGGKDTLDGGSGSGDTANYSDKTTSVAVTLQGATDATVKVGGVAEDTIRNFENLSGGTGDDTLIGDGQANVLNGFAGDDLLKGGGGKDTLDGGSGSGDTANYSDKTTSVAVTLQGATDATVKVGGVAEDTIRNFENLSGGTGDDTLIGDGQANVLNGFAGDDLLKGGGGKDTLDGGSGSGDTANYSDKTTSVAVTLQGATDATVKVGGVVEDTIRNFENLSGGTGDDTLIGDGQANVLNGFAGDDLLKGGGGKGTLDGGSGSGDTANYSDKTTSVAVTLQGATDATVKVGGVVEDTIRNFENLSGGTGDDTLIGDGQANVLNSFAGNDLLKGGGGKDTLDGGSGSGDTANYSDKTTSVVVTLNGATDATVKVGGVVEDTIRNIENLTGGIGKDTLIGDGQANVLNGAGGADALTGAAGADTFVFSSGLGASNVDHITDFASVDTIDLEDSIFTSLTTTGTLSANSFFAGAGATSAHDADDRIVYNTTSGALFFDADGSGGTAAVQFAILDNHAALTNADFVVV